jgi:hypothetical protein
VPNPPKMDPARGARGRGIMRLPAEGRKGATPKWPLDEPASREEKRAWAELWGTPQAVAWEKLGWTRTVARYCRVMIECEYPGAQPTRLAQATALEDRLGLTPKAMRLLLWSIVDDEMAQARTDKKRTARGRIAAVG